MKQTRILYKVAATFIRGNIGHLGHVDLIEKMLERAEIAHIHLSGASSNNTYEVRELLLKVLCKHRGIPMERVSFRNTPNVNEALKHSIAEAPFGEVIFCVGEDRADMAFQLADHYDTGCFLNRRLTSSTNMRFFIDDPALFDELIYLYENNTYAVAIASMLRAEERQREESGKSSAKTRRIAKACSNAQIESAHDCTLG
jgi:hypothetical protein